MKKFLIAVSVILVLAYVIMTIGTNMKIADEQPEKFYLHGQFKIDTEEYKVAEFASTVESFGADILILESRALQFDILDITESTCMSIHEIATDIDYIETVDPCLIR